MSLFSGLEKYGIEKFDDIDVKEKEKQKQGECKRNRHLSQYKKLMKQI